MAFDSGATYGLGGFREWRVKRRSRAERFFDGLVLQGDLRGVLDLRAFRTVGYWSPQGAFGLLGPLVAACTSEGIRRDTGVVSWLHWPNLVTIDDKVVAETSVEVTPPSRSRLQARVVLSMSVNCFAADSARSMARSHETSIKEALGVEIDIDLLRDRILQALDWYYDEWERGKLRKLVERMQPTISWLGRDVEVTRPDGSVIRGRAKGLDDFGSLVLDTRDGQGRREYATLYPGSAVLVREVR